MKRFQSLLLFLLPCLLLWNGGFADEGMYPLSEIARLDLQSKGLQISPSEIYNPEGVSLIDGIVKVNGCSGSFVSPEGLILTNHHCAFGAIQTASSEENNYLANGFLAGDRSEEIPAKGYTVRITQTYRDISEEVLQAANGISDPAKRTEAIDKRINEITLAAEKENPGRRAEVAEMFIGKTYLLFLYAYLKDVRLVYAPPRSIGEFGGEKDNWEWPRHTGDFSFMRVYTAPDGSPAEYSPENIPYKPRRHFRVAAEGVEEEDFVFILGYPGRTQRHRTSYYLAYEEEIELPYIIDLYDWQISVMEEMGTNNPSLALKFASKIKSKSNILKRSRGKLQGLQGLQLAERKRQEEKELRVFIESDPQRRKEYGDLLSGLEKFYEEIRAGVEYKLALHYLPNSCDLFYFAKTIYEASLERQKENVLRLSAYMDRNFDKTRKDMLLKLRNYEEISDRLFLKNMLARLLNTPEGQKLAALSEPGKKKDPEKALDQFINKLYQSKLLTDEQFLLNALAKSPREIEDIDDPFIQFAVALYPAYQEMNEINKRREGEISQLQARLIDVKKQFLHTDFVPDANGTLRLTYGRIRGFSPADALYMNPITTLKGVIEKTTGKEPFDTPQKLIELYQTKDYGQFRHPRLDDVPVAILYNTDTTGGNSGSAVLNARGEIIGVNFDRTFQATVNDYAWSESYSRSIGVDIRYVLWITQKFGGAQYLLHEMGVEDKNL